jgi:hypothetical protein
MNKGFLCSMLLFPCIVMTACIGFIDTHNRQIGIIPAGTHGQLSFEVNLPRRSTSWEVGLWPRGTNIADFAGRHVVAKLTNLSERNLTLSPGLTSPYDKVLSVIPSQTVVVCDGPVKSLAHLHLLFGCNTRQHGVSFQLNLEFRPPVRVQKQMTLLARGRDAL